MSVIKAPDAPPSELVNLRDRTFSLLKLKGIAVRPTLAKGKEREYGEVIGKLSQVEELIREICVCRLSNPAHAEALLSLEVKLLDHYPAANPDGDI